MGLADFFTKEGRQARNLQKMIQRASDKHAQSPDRFRALELLRDDGSPEAVIGLLRRFSFVYDKTIEDEQEKEWIYHELVGMGTKVLPAPVSYTHLDVYKRQVESELYLAMDYIDGKDLRAVWNRCAKKGIAFPVDVAVHIARELARGLHYAHNFGNIKLVHRDVSPPNVLVSFNGEVKLTDFGLASSTRCV